MARERWGGKSSFAGIKEAVVVALELNSITNRFFGDQSWREVVSKPGDISKGEEKISQIRVIP